MVSRSTGKKVLSKWKKGKGGKGERERRGKWKERRKGKGKGGEGKRDTGNGGGRKETGKERGQRAKEQKGNGKWEKGKEKVRVGVVGVMDDLVRASVMPWNRMEGKGGSKGKEKWIDRMAGAKERT
jgi:hypothetical protein